jgi:protoporphyrinogen IX oxidase
MTDLMSYNTLKALHIIAVISWMAGMLYLPRLYVYHTAAKAGGELDETLKIMEKRLLRFIMAPAMIASFIFGLGLLFINPALMQEGSMHAKILLVLLMAGCHGFLAKCRKDFAMGQNRRSQKFYRILNEVPTVLMIGIVVLVVLKPF